MTLWNRRRRSPARLAAALAALVASAGALSARAQDLGVDASQSQIPGLKEETPLVAWGLAALFCIASLVLAFWSSKRGHLD